MDEWHVRVRHRTHINALLCVLYALSWVTVLSDIFPVMLSQAMLAIGFFLLIITLSYSLWALCYIYRGRGWLKKNAESVSLVMTPVIILCGSACVLALVICLGIQVREVRELLRGMFT